MAAWSGHARDEAGRALPGGFSDAPGIEADPAQSFEGDREQSTLPQMSQPSNRCWMTCEKSPSTLVGAMEATTLIRAQEALSSEQYEEQILAQIQGLS
ncbi:hypothetical protein [Nonomuraea fuscirosea]|uniref:hypothetical protein n=1 Tax=Nonomuraea fuscirosea TaxID=1291556 RepID=UPI0015E7495C|nr:hypothetical protein [Nonomuraea fuscirosea]